MWSNLTLSPNPSFHYEGIDRTRKSFDYDGVVTTLSLEQQVLYLIDYKGKLKIGDAVNGLPPSRVDVSYAETLGLVVAYTLYNEYDRITPYNSYIHYKSDILPLPGAKDVVIYKKEDRVNPGQSEIYVLYIQGDNLFSRKASEDFLNETLVKKVPPLMRLVSIVTSSKTTINLMAPRNYKIDQNEFIYG